MAPEFVGQAAGQLENIGSALSSAHAAAAVPTTSLAAAAGDEVSAAIASLFSSHAEHYQALNAQAAAFHNQFTNLLNAGAGSYVTAEIANTQAAGTGGIGQFLGGGLLSVYNGASNQYLELPLDAAGSVITAATWSPRSSITATKLSGSFQVSTMSVAASSAGTPGPDGTGRGMRAGPASPGSTWLLQ